MKHIHLCLLCIFSILYDIVNYVYCELCIFSSSMIWWLVYLFIISDIVTYVSFHCWRYCYLHWVKQYKIPSNRKLIRVKHGWNQEWLIIDNIMRGGNYFKGSLCTYIKYLLLEMGTAYTLNIHSLSLYKYKFDGVTMIGNTLQNLIIL